MTREEIIEHLDSIVGTYEILLGHGVNSDVLDVDDIEAIKEAISALSENKGDLISRQAVLNTLDNMDKALDEERTVEKYKELLIECIKVLPSGSENIRCKDCKFLKVCGDDISPNHMCDNSRSWVVATDLNFGCVLAERAEE